MSELVTEDKVHDALVYLASTDMEAAKARARMDSLKAVEKTILGLELLQNQEVGGTVAERDAMARNSEAYGDWLEDYENACADWYLLQNKRSTAHIITEVWRSYNANLRKGNV